MEVADYVEVTIECTVVGHVGTVRTCSIIAVACDGTEVVDVLHVDVCHQTCICVALARVHKFAEPAQVVWIGNQIVAILDIGNYA